MIVTTTPESRDGRLKSTWDRCRRSGLGTDSIRDFAAQLADFFARTSVTGRAGRCPGSVHQGDDRPPRE